MRSAAPQSAPRGVAHRGRRWLFALLVYGLAAVAGAQSFDFDPPPAGDPRLAIALQDLALRVIPVYQDADRRRYLENLSRLQLVSGDAASAWAARLSLRELGPAAPAPALDTLPELYTRSRALERESHVSFGQSYAAAVATLLAGQDETQALAFLGSARQRLPVLRQRLDEALQAAHAAHGVTLAEALSLVQRWLDYIALEQLDALLPQIVAADEQQRYIIDALPAAAIGPAAPPITVVRPRTTPGRLDTVLELAAPRGAREAAIWLAAHGYAVVQSGEDRDAGRDPFTPPLAATTQLVEWIRHRDWSSGRLALIGAGRSATVGWAALARAPAGIASVALASPDVPGVSLALAGGIFVNAALEELLQLAPEASHGLDLKWYQRGAAYRTLDRLARQPNPRFQQWLEHPLYDDYWRARTPDSAALGHLEAPVLLLGDTADPAQAGVLHAWSMLARAGRHADTLVVSDSVRHGAGLHAPIGEPSPTRELMLRWLQSTLGREPRGAPLAPGVSFSLADGSTVHRAEVPRSNNVRSLFLAGRGAASCRLLDRAPALAALRQRLDLRDRRPEHATPDLPPEATALRVPDGLVCTGAPLAADLLSLGEPEAHLLVTSNRFDFDLQLALYELTPDGTWHALFTPAARQRASVTGEAMREARERTLLPPGEAVRLDFPLGRMVARRVHAGSRIAVVVHLLRRADMEINYGTGGTVADESLVDAGTIPLEVEWLAGSHIDLPAAGTPAP